MTYVLPSGITVAGIDPATVEVGPEGVVYLLHFDVPYKHARHYTGWSGQGNLAGRLYHHRTGNGARLLAVLAEQNIGWHLARVYPGDRNLERRLKNRGGASRRCPACGIKPAGTATGRGPDGRFLPKTPILIGAS
jgi:hypothetical protein